MRLSFKLITPQRLVLQGDADCVTLPAVKGPLGMLPHHTHVVVDLVPGIVRIIREVEGEEDQVERYRIAKGVAEMSKEGRLTVFADRAERL